MSKEILIYTINQIEKTPQECWKSIAEMTRVSDRKRVLVVLEVSKTLSQTKAYSILKKLISMGFLGVKIAFVINDTDNFQKSFMELNGNDFTEGLFFSTEDAKDWLLEV